MQIFPVASRHGGLLRALALSLVFHILLLWPAALVWREATPANPLVASLRPSSAPVAPATVPDILPKPVAKPRPEQGPKPTLTDTLVLPEPKAQVVDTVASTAAATENSGMAAPEPQPVIASALPVSAGLDADGLRSYRLALAREARRHKRYPARAIDAGWEGTAELRVTVTARAAPTVHLLRSSGHAALDAAALDMLGKAIPATALPVTLKDREFSVDLPVVFELPQ